MELPRFTGDEKPAALADAKAPPGPASANVAEQPPTSGASDAAKAADPPKQTASDASPTSTRATTSSSDSPKHAEESVVRVTFVWVGLAVLAVLAASLFLVRKG